MDRKNKQKDKRIKHLWGKVRAMVKVGTFVN